MMDAFVFITVVVIASAVFSVLAYLADSLLRRKTGRGIVPKDYYDGR